MLLLTLRGTPTLYYGDEIGMQRRADPAAGDAGSVEQNVPGLGLGRDPERTPMQWDRERNAGFTVSSLAAAPQTGGVNVEAERDDPRSMLTLYRRLIELRRASRRSRSACT